MFKSFQTILWVIVFGLAFGNIYAQQSSLKTLLINGDKAPKTFILNPEAECTGAGELIYDDGTFENGYGWNTTVTDGRFLQLATPPSYPWQFNTFCIALTHNGASSTFTFDIIVYDNSGAGGTPGTIIATVPGVIATGVPTWPALAFYDFDISSVPPLASGSCFVGIKWNPAVQTGFYIGADESTTTPIWLSYVSPDGGATWTTNQTYWATYRAMGIRTLGSSGPPCPVEPATNPSPVNGATGISITSPGNATWTNGAGTTQVEVFFGPQGSSVSVYNGAPITSYAIPTPLNYMTTYEWKVVCKNDTCSGAPVATWTFTTVQDPNLNCWTDDFTAGTGNWTITNDGGTCVWAIFQASEYTLPPTAVGNVLAADVDFCGSGTTLLSTATITAPFDFSLYQNGYIEFDNDWQAISASDFGYVEVSTDGTNWTTVRTFDVVDVRNTHEVVDITAIAALQPTVYVRLRTIQPGWDWWWAVDNFTVCASNPIPVELTSFVAATDNRNVTLNWSTATELNNSGFQIERSNGSEYQSVGFIAGHGTTTEIQNYSYVDQNVVAGKYSYRLKQVDFDGAFEYSNIVEVEVLGVKEFTLGQNYPNPFNPSTTINFSLAVDSKVSLKIFDVLGQEVTTLVNGQLAAGSQKVSFDASSLNSGVYFYRIDADGIDGQKFSSVKKMILTK